MTPGASSSAAVSPPMPRTRLIGREAEREAARAWLLDEAVPLLTLTGTGGVGKTRLALEIASDVKSAFGDGVVWVDLSALTDPTLTANAIAAALGVAMVPNRPVEQAVGDHLRPLQALVLLDNCEHVVAAAAEVAGRLLATCPALQILATSRARLRVRGEQALPVAPLPLPNEEQSGLAAAEGSEAVRLFGERARAADPAFALTEKNAAAVAALCRGLDGLPLAIELAAARVAVLPPEVLLARMGSRRPMLRDGARDAPSRQQTMWATIAWSYDLLDPEAQSLFRRLAVFVGGFGLEAMEAVWPPLPGGPGEDALLHFNTLVEHHLVRRDPASDDAEPRYTMLETVREFGLERLAAAGEEAGARTRHARYCWALVDDLNAKVAPHLPEAAAVFARLDREHPNLRVALAWFAGNGMAEEFVSLAGWLTALWLHLGYTREGRDWLEQAVAMASDASPAARVWALVGLFATLWSQREDESRALLLIDEAIAVARSSGDPLSIGLATEWGAMREHLTGDVLAEERLVHEARAAFASLPSSPWVERNLTHVDWELGSITFLRGDAAGAEEQLLAVSARQRLLERAHGAPYSYTSDVINWLGHIALVRGDFTLALDRYQRALHDAKPAQDMHGIVVALCGIAGTLACAGCWPAAARLFGATEAICERAGFSFADWVFAWQRAIGLPDPWQRGELQGMPAVLRSLVQRQFPRPLPPLPDPAAAERFWAAGAALSLEEVISEASAANLETSGPLAADRIPPAPTPDSFGLSPREREVLALVCQRFSNAEIGEALFISPRTASSHVAHIFDKLGTGSRRETAALAARHGLV